MIVGPSRFEIGFATSELDEQGHGRGYIRLNDFEEQFVVPFNFWQSYDYLHQWRESLRRLVGVAPAVGLVTWMVAPRSEDWGRAWVLYRERDVVFVHEQMFASSELKFALDPDWQLRNISRRITATEDGTPVSEWRVDFSAIERFLRELERTD